MYGLAFIIFGSVFGLALVAVGIAWKIAEAEQKRRVEAAVEVTGGAAVLSAPTVLVQKANQGPSVVERLLKSLNISARVQQYLEQSGLTWGTTGLLARMGVAALAGALAGLRLRILVDAVPSMVALAVAASFIPWLWVMRKRSKRLAEFEKQFPEALDFLARAIRAGHALSISLEMLASDSPEPVRSEFRRVHSEQHLGEQLAVVLRHLAERVPLVDVKFFVSAVLMQRETGGNLGEILTKLSNVIRERFRIKGQIRALSAHGRITATVLTILPAVTILGLMAINPDYLGSLLREPEGKYFIIGSIAGQVLGYLSMRRILDIKV